jgi:PAS domain S-box-containing protein
MPTATTTVAATPAPDGNDNHPFYEAAVQAVLLSQYVPLTALVDARGTVLAMYGREHAEILPPSARGKPLLLGICDDLRTTFVETFRQAVTKHTTVTALPQYLCGESFTEHVTIAVHPLVLPDILNHAANGHPRNLAREHQQEPTANESVNTLFGDEYFLVIFHTRAVEAAHEATESLLAKALQRSEQRYRQILHSVTDYSFTVLVEHGKVVQTQHGANCVAVTGYTSQEYYANTMLWIDMVHPDDRENVRQQADDILRHQKAYPLEHRIIHKNGSTRWVRNTPVLRTNEQGVMTGYDGLVYDITERKTTELQLRENEEQLRFILEQSPLGVVLASANNRIVKANTVFCEMLGYDEQELRNKPIAELTPEEDWQKELSLVESLKQGVVHIARIEKRFITKSQERIWVNLNVSYVRDSKGQPVFALGIVENITARKQAETALRNSEARLHALMQHTNDAVVITDAEGVFQYASPSIARMLYYKPESLVGKQALSYIHPDDRAAVQAVYSRLVELPINAMKSYQYRYRRADGTWAKVESVSTNLLTHPLISGIVTNTRDISERSSTEEEEE